MFTTQVVRFTVKTQPDILALRHQVFTLEQGVSAELDIDGLDDNALHCVIYSDKKIVATGRLLTDGHIGRVAVLAAFRHQGLGNTVMKSLMGEAKKRGDSQVFLHAQISALEFYQKLGFVSYGEPFLDAGIKHIAMLKTLK
ncbi:MAG: GNAT family N-acetyltransferase [Pseudomonadales bacterium]|nr:GNAT family N-acetyltransferase [Pseudomonadales bacterium]